jgi:nucleoside-diphosphate-sugar epimerase
VLEKIKGNEVGSHVANVFLQDGSYDVYGTVRDPNNEAKVKPLREGLAGFEQLTLVQADLLQPESLMAAIQGADIVVHTASPFPL